MHARHRSSRHQAAAVLLLLMVSACALSQSPSDTQPFQAGDATPIAQAAGTTLIELPSVVPQESPTETPEPVSSTPPPTDTVEPPEPTPEQTSSPTATGSPTATPLPTQISMATSVPTATVAAPTALPTATLLASATGTASPTAMPDCSPGTAYVADVTIPDNTVIVVGQSFTKTWSLRNSGTCPWTAGYELRHVGGERMATSSAVPASPADPGAMVDVSVTMTAPATAGQYRSEWQMCEQGAACFGQKVYVLISVREPTPLPSATTPITSTPVPTSAPAAQPFGDGTWRVGTDIVPGTYRSTGTSSCYWERLNAFTGSFDAIIANDNASGPAVVTVLASDAGFAAKRCGTWVPTETDQPAAPAARITDGTWRVGIDIVPGLYRAADTQGCYWERLSGFSGGLGEILANDNAVGPALVAISPGDVGFSSRRCGTWVLADTDQSAAPARTFGDGAWRVGIDIAPGTYRTTGVSGCYWERLSGFGGSFYDIIANDNADGSALVTIAPSDVGFSCTRCGTWVPAD